MNTLIKTFSGIAVGALVGGTAVWLLGGAEPTATTARQPLYWVAPMDPNFKSDKPGKSPMGMDLIPVYEKQGADNSPGTVTISAEVVNNMGVRTATVARGNMLGTVQTVGYVQYDEDRLVHVAPRVEGWIEKLHVKAAGDPLKQGEPLYDLYSPTLVNAQEELLLAQKRNNPALIQAAIERLSALQVPKAEIDRIRSSGRVKQSIRVNAPQSGVVDNLMVREGMFVKPGMSLMAIGQLEHIWVIGEIFERQASLVQLGDRVRMQLDYLPGRKWLGKVDYLYPTLDTRTRTARIRVRFDNPDEYLKPGMFARMDIESAPMDDSLLIPREALIRTGNQSRVVLALGEGRFKSIAVKVGHIDEKQAQITAGLNEGDRIVTSAQFLIDSESSKSSDFRRMHQDTDENEPTSQQEQPSVPTSVWVNARVVKLMAEHRMLTLAHEAIPAWQWPAMTMDFSLAPGVMLNELKLDMQLQVQLSRDEDKIIVSQIQRINTRAAKPGGDAQGSERKINTEHSMPAEQAGGSELPNEHAGMVMGHTSINMAHTDMNKAVATSEVQP